MDCIRFVLDDWPSVIYNGMVKSEQAATVRISTLEERSKWHLWALWGLGAAMLGLITWWIPHESNALRDSIKADTSAQLEPIKIDLVRLNALLQLKESKNVSEAIRLGVDFSEPKYAMEAVKAIVQQAKAETIQTEPSVLIRTSEKVEEAANANPALFDAAWSTRLALADYRSSLPVEQTAKENHPPSFTFNGLTVDGGKISGGHQTLDGVYWKDFTFNGVVIEYDGGPMILENVKFINCTFKMKFNKRSEQFGDRLLAQNPVTSSFS
jgi:hypothetical protein